MKNVIWNSNATKTNVNQKLKEIYVHKDENTASFKLYQHNQKDRL